MNPRITCRSCLPLVLMLLVANDAMAGAKLTPEYKNRSAAIASIGLLPAQAQMATIKVGADDAMVAESAEFERMGRSEAIAMLKAQGYQVVAPTVDDIQDDPELNELYRNAMARYDAETDKVRRKAGQVKKRRFNMGSEFSVLANYLKVDAIGVPRMVVQGASGGQMTMAILIGGSSGLAQFDLTVINGAQGDVEGFLYYARGGVSAKGLKDKEKGPAIVAQVVSKALRKLPAAAENGRLAAANEQEDEAVMSELEGLLEDTEDRDEEQEQN